MKIHDVDYFIEKFDAIPEECWCIGAFTNPKNSRQHCVMGHCGVCRLDNLQLFGSNEAHSIRQIFDCAGLNPTAVNDIGSLRYPQLTPKGRILAALREIKSYE